MFKFMSKPSVNSNNKLKDEFSKSYNLLIYKIQKNRVNSHLKEDELKEVCKKLEENFEEFDNAIGSGQEDVDRIYNNCSKKLKELSKNLDRESMVSIKSSAKELIKAVDEWKDVLNGEIELGEDDYKEAKVNWKEAKILDKLNELLEIKTKLEELSKYEESKILAYEKQVEEYNDKILEEESQWKLNEYFRNIKSIESNKNKLISEKSNYDICYSLLNSIYENVDNIVKRGNGLTNKEDLAKARAYLDLDKLKNVINDPAKALFVMKKMEDDIKKLDENTKKIEDKISSFESSSSTITNEALNYKEELLARKKRKEAMDELNDSKINKDKKEIKGEN